MPRPKNLRYANLSPQEVRLINAYLKGFTKTAAAKEAGYPPSVYKTNYVQLFRKPAVAQEIDVRKREMAKRNELTEDWIIEQLMKAAGATVGDMVVLDKDGSPRLDFKKLSPELRSFMKSFESKEIKDGRGDGARNVLHTKVSGPDQLRAIEMLMKILGMGKETIEIKSDQEDIRQLWEAQDRLNKKWEDDDGTPKDSV